MRSSDSTIPDRVSRELGLSFRQVERTLALFGEGATLPFIARYRKEATGGLDEVQLRDVRDRAAYLVALEERRETILASIEEQGALAPELRAAIEGAETRQELEDLYLPHRPKRRTRATIAEERGLGPLAEGLWEGRLDDRGARVAAAVHVDPERGVPDVEAALQGARDILAERIAEDPALRALARERVGKTGVVRSRAARGKGDTPEARRFQDYLDHEESVLSIPSHRMLAIRRGEAEGVLAWGIVGPEEELVAAARTRTLEGRAARGELALAVEDALKRILLPSIGAEIAQELKERADREAIRIFGENLEQLLLQPPAGPKSVLGLDPGFRTGVKAALISETGAVLATDTLMLHQENRFRKGLGALLIAHRPEFIAIGNGTASRETQAAVREALAGLASDPAFPRSPQPTVVLVNEAGASIYSASDLAREEFPTLDVSVRGAISIARRLQDPLAELVKIDPRSIGVGQYQHDVHQPSLRDRLDETVTLCVNRVGVDLNTASPSLLGYVAGIGPTLARRIVEVRDREGGFESRAALRTVPRLGAKAFEQAAGFLRIREGAHPLDATGVHPERYGLVERMAADLGVSVGALVENAALIDRLEGDLERYRGEDLGLPTLRDIIGELRRPGRDPRESFDPPAFREDVREMNDLRVGMVLEGVVTNVAAFGAFVDVGVHQDGLVHVSKLADRFVKDPSEVVKVGQKVRVTVLAVDAERRRISLSMRKER